MTRTIDCEAFADDAADLALGFSPEPLRSALLAHAADCARCAAELADLGRTVDALVELAPEVEPPAGFEARAVAAMRPAARPAHRRSTWIGAVAAAVLLLVGLVAAVSSVIDDEAEHDPSALIRTTDGDVLGRVELASSPSPTVVVVVEADDWKGTWVCELQRPDGTWVAVGRWEADDAPTGAWSAAIDDELLDATAMRITVGDGRVVARSDTLA